MLRQSQESMLHAWNQSRDVGCGRIDTMESVLLDSRQGQGRELKQGTWISGSMIYCGYFSVRAGETLVTMHVLQVQVSSKGCGDKGLAIG